MEKTCTKCHVTKCRETAFLQASGYADGWRTQCNACVNANKQRWRKTDRGRQKQHEEYLRAKARGTDYYTKHRRRYQDKHIRAKSGIGLDDYERILAEQGGRCKICQSDDPGRAREHRFAIDHDHACCAGKTCCGKCIRGLLCSRCNVGIGMFRDDLKALRSAIDYLRAPAIVPEGSTKTGV